MKKALLAVSFGTSVPRARQSIQQVERALAAAAPGRAFARAYTSPTIRRILAGRGETVDGLEQALEKLAAAGVEDVVVQPTHLLYGIEYDKMKASADAFAPRFASFAFGRPLLASAADLRALAACVQRAYAPAQGALVLLGHGTGHFANMVYPAMQTALRLQGAADTFVGTVEGWPALEDVLAQLQAGGYDRVTLAPLMLVAGDHACNDMAGPEPDSWKSRLEAAGLAVTCRMEGLGLLEDVRALYAAHLRELL